MKSSPFYKKSNSDVSAYSDEKNVVPWNYTEPVHANHDMMFGCTEPRYGAATRKTVTRDPGHACWSPWLNHVTAKLQHVTHTRTSRVCQATGENWTPRRFNAQSLWSITSGLRNSYWCQRSSTWSRILALRNNSGRFCLGWICLNARF